MSNKVLMRAIEKRNAPITKVIKAFKAFIKSKRVRFLTNQTQNSKKNH